MFSRESDFEYNLYITHLLVVIGYIINSINKSSHSLKVREELLLPTTKIGSIVGGFTFLQNKFRFNFLKLPKYT